MLGVCHRLGKIFGIDPLLFQILFVIWFLSNQVAFFYYLVIALVIYLTD
jgi:phage shock protein PspC (stress-responsive transcriptional regulator)